MSRHEKGPGFEPGPATNIPQKESILNTGPVTTPPVEERAFIDAHPEIHDAKPHWASRTVVSLYGDWADAEVSYVRDYPHGALSVGGIVRDGDVELEDPLVTLDVESTWTADLLPAIIATISDMRADVAGPGPEHGRQVDARFAGGHLTVTRAPIPSGSDNGVLLEGPGFSVALFPHEATALADALALAATHARGEG